MAQQVAIFPKEPQNPIKGGKSVQTRKNLPSDLCTGTMTSTHTCKHTIIRSFCIISMIVPVIIESRRWRQEGHKFKVICIA